MTRSRPRHHAAGLVAAIAVAAAAGPASAAELVPHRALYSLKLSTTRSGSGILDARGNMHFALEQTCDGWTIAETLSLVVDSANGAFEQEMHYAGWESADGTTYRFVSRHRLGGDRGDTRGRARAGQAGEAVFKSPAARTLPLPEGTLFPVGHTTSLIDHAVAGSRQVPSTVFDGIDGEGPQKVVAFIGPRRRPDVEGDDPDSLTNRPRWTMRLAFYPVDSAASAPQYEMEAVQLDNGVVSRLVLDFNEFAVILELETVTALARPVC